MSAMVYLEPDPSCGPFSGSTGSGTNAAIFSGCVVVIAATEPWDAFAGNCPNLWTGLPIAGNRPTIPTAEAVRPAIQTIFRTELIVSALSASMKE
jgi:hypothetical protein